MPSLIFCMVCGVAIFGNSFAVLYRSEPDRYGAQFDPSLHREP
jgi:hypothetical protein